MGYMHVDDCTLRPGSGSSSAPIVYFVDSPEHPFDLSPLPSGLQSNVVSIPVASWDDSLTPWVAAGIYREEPDSGGRAGDTLTELLGEVIPAIERANGLTPTHRAICGYSLGGLFSLYAFTHAHAFDACGCLSGSVWYEGWVDHLRSLDLDLTGKFAFLSLGTKERRAARPILRTVADNMEACAGILRQRGCEVRYEQGPGNHLQHIPERVAAGITALDAFLGEEG